MTASSVLRVLSWNLGEIYWPWHGNQLKDRDVDAVVEGLVEIDADVVLVQELASSAQLARLERAGYVGAMPASCGYDRHVGLLVRGHAPTFSEHVLSPTKRAIVQARFSVGKRRVRALSLHFDVFRPERRLEQARVAAGLIAQADDDELVIAGGDLNYDPEASRRLGRRADLAVEALLTERLVDIAADSGPTLVGLLRVDRLFAGGPDLDAARAYTSRRRLPLGDHAPLVAELSLAVDDAVPLSVDAVDEGP